MSPRLLHYENQSSRQGDWRQDPEIQARVGSLAVPRFERFPRVACNRRAKDFGTSHLADTVGLRHIVESMACAVRAGRRWTWRLQLYRTRKRHAPFGADGRCGQIDRNGHREERCNDDADFLCHFLPFPGIVPSGPAAVEAARFARNLPGRTQVEACQTEAEHGDG